MKFTILTNFILGAVSVLAARNGHCSNGSKTGICIPTSECHRYGGVYTSGNCKWDPADIKCCEAMFSCSPSNGVGTFSQCKWTQDGCSASGWAQWENNKCPGGNNFKCCVMNNKVIPV